VARRKTPKIYPEYPMGVLQTHKKAALQTLLRATDFWSKNLFLKRISFTLLPLFYCYRRLYYSTAGTLRIKAGKAACNILVSITGDNTREKMKDSQQYPKAHTGCVLFAMTHCEYIKAW